jgi:LPXTG-motif cell wall-anchored protein
MMFPGGMEPSGGEGNLFVRIVKNNWLPMLLGLVVIVLFVYIVRLKKKAKEEFFDE